MSKSKRDLPHQEVPTEWRRIVMEEDEDGKVRPVAVERVAAQESSSTSSQNSSSYSSTNRSTSDETPEEWADILESEETNPPAISLEGMDFSERTIPGMVIPQQLYEEQNTLESDSFDKREAQKASPPSNVNIDDFDFSDPPERTVAVPAPTRPKNYQPASQPIVVPQPQNVDPSDPSSYNYPPPPPALLDASNNSSQDSSFDNRNAAFQHRLPPPPPDIAKQTYSSYGYENASSFEEKSSNDSSESYLEEESHTSAEQTAYDPSQFASFDENASSSQGEKENSVGDELEISSEDGEDSGEYESLYFEQEEEEVSQSQELMENAHSIELAAELKDEETESLSSHELEQIEEMESFESEENSYDSTQNIPSASSPSLEAVPPKLLSPPPAIPVIPETSSSASIAAADLTQLLSMQEKLLQMIESMKTPLSAQAQESDSDSSIEQLFELMSQQQDLLMQIRRQLPSTDEISQLHQSLEQLSLSVRESQNKLEENSIYQVMQEFLPLYDYVDLRFRSLWESHGKDHPLVYEISAIRDRILEIFQRQSITPINANDLNFDPHYHQALQEAPAQLPEEDGQISRIFRQGFLYQNRVFRLMEVEVKRYRRH